MKLPQITIYQGVPNTRPLDRRDRGGRPIMKLVEPSPLGINGVVHWAPARFEFDGSSSPSITWPLVLPNDPRYLLAALWHDYAYACQLWPREYADLLFLAIMIERGVPVWLRQSKYQSVRFCGGKHYRRNPPEEIAWNRSLGGIYAPSTQSPLVEAWEPVVELTVPPWEKKHG